MHMAVRNMIEEIEQIESRRHHGRAAGVLGRMVEVAGLRRNNALVLCARGLPATDEDTAAPDTDGWGERL